MGSPLPVPLPGPNPTPLSVATCEPIGNCDAYSWCSQTSYVEWCNSQDECSSPFCKTVSSAPLPYQQHCHQRQCRCRCRRRLPLTEDVACPPWRDSIMILLCMDQFARPRSKEMYALLRCADG